MSKPVVTVGDPKMKYLDIHFVQRRALKGLINFTAVIGSVIFIIVYAFLDIAKEQIALVGLLLLIQSLIIFTAFMYGRLSFNKVATGFVVYTMSVGVVALIFSGPLPGPFLSICISLLSAGLFLGRGAAMLMLGVSALVFFALGFCHYEGLLLQPPGEAFNMADPINSLRLFGIVICLYAVITLFVTYFSENISKLFSAFEAETKERLTLEKSRHEAEKALQQLQKMESLGHLAATVAHDFNNALAIVTLWNEMMASHSDDEFIQEGAEEIRQAMKVATSLTQKMMTISNNRLVIDSYCSPRDVLNLNRRSIRSLLPEDVQLSILCETLANVPISETEMQQVILNLTLNANEAMPEGGKLTLKLDEVSFTKPELSLGLEAGDYISLSVSDTGLGIDSEVLGKIFEPFFTTKVLEKGTGLGLTSVFGIVRGGGGSIDVESELGFGTRFVVYLPLILPKVDIESSQKIYKRAKVNLPRTILLVEDELSLLKSMSMVLKQNGYQVLTALNGVEALEVLKSKPVDLVCTDAIMPVMGVKGIIDFVQREKPALPILICSAHVDEVLIRRGVTRGLYAFLQKPFSSQDLCQKIADCLEQSNGSDVSLDALNKKQQK